MKYIFLLLPILLLSCKFYTASNDENSFTVNSNSLLVQDSLFFKQSENNEYTFALNDPQYSSSKGYTFLNILESSTVLDEIEFSAVKESGSLSCGYGIAFDFNSDVNSTAISNTTFLCVLIRISGEYAIGKVTNGQYTPIYEWTKCSALKTGVGIDNIMKVSKQEGQWKITFNDNSDLSILLSSKSNNSELLKHGFIVVVSPNENFPITSVKVRFRV